MSRPYIIKVSSRKNPHQKFVGVVRYSRASEKIVLLKQFMNIELLSWNNTAELNKFLTNGGDNLWVLDKVDRPKGYYTPAVFVNETDRGYVCTAEIYDSYESATSGTAPITTFRGPEAGSLEGAASAFWSLWNHGNHDFKTEEGRSARLSRLTPNYKLVTKEVTE